MVEGLRGSDPGTSPVSWFMGVGIVNYTKLLKMRLAVPGNSYLEHVFASVSFFLSPAIPSNSSEPMPNDDLLSFCSLYDFLSRSSVTLSISFF